MKQHLEHRLDAAAVGTRLNRLDRQVAKLKREVAWLTRVLEELTNLQPELGISFEQRKRFLKVAKVLTGLPAGAQRLFWLTPKASLGGATPLAALAIGLDGDVKQSAEGFAAR